MTITSFPSTITSVEIQQSGGPEVLTMTQRPLRLPTVGEILIKVAAAGVNRPDVLQRKGLYAPPAGASDIPGLEVAGEVVAIGQHPDGKTSSRFQCSDRVCALTAGGGYAEYCLVDERHALPLPANLSFIEGASMPETFFTVWVNLFQRGHLRAGEVLLVHGGTSGIGCTATLLGKAFGATVLTTVGSEEKRHASLALGADLAINYRTQDFVAETLAATDGKGANVIIDLLAGDYVARNYQAAAMEGRIIQIGTQNGVVNGLNIMPLLLKRLTHTGSTLRSRSADDKAIIAQGLEQHVWPLLQKGALKLPVDTTFPLEQAAAAHSLMESSQHIGKIVLTV